MKFTKCRICEKEKSLTKHHLIPKRLTKKYDNWLIYICSDCSKKIHPENELILRIKQLDLYHKTMKSFLMEKHPDIWEEWKPYRKKIKDMYDEQIKKTKIESFK